MFLRNTARLAALGLLSFILVACGGSSSSTSCASVNANCNDPVQSFNALGADGPMAFAIIELFRLSDYLLSPIGAPNLLDASARSDANGQALGLNISQSDGNGNPPGAGPFVLQVRVDAGTTLDTTTGAEPVIKAVRSIITAADFAARSDTTFFYATPLTTIGVDQAIALAGSTDTADVVNQMQAASTNVLQAFGFGLDPASDIFRLAPVLDPSTDGDLPTQSAVAQYRAAIETVAEIVAQVVASESVTATQIIDAVSADMSNDPNAYVGENPGNATVDALVTEVATVDTNYLSANGRFPSNDGSANIEELLDGELPNSAPLAGAINAAPQKADFDGDGSPNDADSDNYDPTSSADTDGDTIDDSVDNCPNDANGPSDPSNQLDNDGDGIGDVCDPDADGDGVNGDGAGGPGDDDNDLNNMVITDAEPSTGAGDVPGDGIDDVGGNGPNGPLNGPDNCVLGALDDLGNSISAARAENPDQTNTDVDLNNNPDAFGDQCDNDADGDSAPGDGSGGPGTGPGSDPDDLDPTVFPGETDADGVADVDDNCPGTPNASQTAGTTNAFGKAEPFGVACDFDDDGFPDTAAEDIPGTLGDGIPVDNCPMDANPGQEDNDALTDPGPPALPKGDACDTDDDNDSIPDGADPEPFVAVSSYHFDLFYTQQSSAGSDFQLATKSESVLQVAAPTIDTATSNDLDLGTDELGTGNFNITSDYETVQDTLDFAGAACTASNCFATAAATPTMA
ncbi:MAG: hypothetical protein HKO60_01535, partial [Pseudomonadales bacterium]|nr:hypothetical protein [Pseudomonadales bacterium]